MCRGVALFFLLAGASVQAQVRINELQCTRSAGSNGQGASGDWVELFNAGKRSVDLAGHVLSMNGRTELLPPGPMLGPGQHRVFLCGKSKEPGADQLTFSLPRKGGTLLLVAPDRSTVLDLFRWPELPPGVSIGRRTDGARAWGFFAEPTPGKPNAGAVSRVLPPPVIAQQDALLAISGDPASTLRYTRDGSLPDERSAAYKAPLALPPGSVLTARAFAPDAVPSAPAVFTTGLPVAAWSLTIAPEDLLGPNGIADVPSGNHARKGRLWQRQARLQHNGTSVAVGMAIAGNGSRSLPKRNFKLLVRDRFGGDAAIALPDSSAWREVFLRADGTPHAFLRNAFMEAVARQSGGRVDVQPSFPLQLYLNGKDQGLYRAMPAKGKEWLRSLNKGEPVEVIEGPGARVVSGGSKHYLHMLKAIADGAGSNGLAPLADLNSLVELACLDVWTGRADHELNVRCWRPRTAEGRWRWVLFDMDQWAPPADRTVQRMCTSAVPETPFLPQLLADPGMRDPFLARLTALMATTLSPDRARQTADSIFRQNREAMALDHDLWKDRMEVPAPDAAYADLLLHVEGRNRNLLAELAKRTGVGVRTLTVSVQPAGSGTVTVEDLPLTASETEMKVYTGVAVHCAAIPAEGMEFAGWKGAEASGHQLAISPLRNTHITALFRPVGLSRRNGLQQRLE